MSIVSLGVMCVSPVYVDPSFLVVPLSRLMCELMATYVVCLASDRASWFMYWSHDGCIFVFYMWWFGKFSMFLGCWES